MRHGRFVLVFFFNDTATTEIYTLSLHDALPISSEGYFPFLCTRDRRRHPRYISEGLQANRLFAEARRTEPILHQQDRKSTRLNSSHANISYAVFCLKKKKQYTQSTSVTVLQLHL